MHAWMAQSYRRSLVPRSCSPADKPGSSASSAVVQLPSTVGFSRVVDLTHALGPDFPTYSGVPELAFDVLRSFDRDRKNVKRWLIEGHIGTHIDAPIHFSEEARTVDQIPIETLIAPLAVIDISRRAQDDPDAELTAEDLAAWEAKHGPIVNRHLRRHEQRLVSVCQYHPLSQCR